jgi:hypothetical protein
MSRRLQKQFGATFIFLGISLRLRFFLDLFLFSVIIWYESILP